MQFENEMKRNLLLHLCLNLVPDLLIATALSVASNGGILGFLAALVGIQALYFSLWLKSSVWSWVLFNLTVRAKSVVLLRDHFAVCKFPEPDEYQTSIYGYLGDVASDENQLANVRVTAALELGGLKYPLSQNRWQEAIRLAMAYEDALIAYKRSISSRAR